MKNAEGEEKQGTASSAATQPLPAALPRNLLEPVARSRTHLPLPTHGKLTTYSTHLAVRAGARFRKSRPRVRRAVDIDPAAAGGRAGRDSRSGSPSPSRAERVDERIDEPLLGLAAGCLVHEREPLPRHLLHEFRPLFRCVRGNDLEKAKKKVVETQI